MVKNTNSSFNLGINAANRYILVWCVVSIGAFFCLPWYMQQEGAWYQVVGQIFSSDQAGSAWVQAWQYGRVWLYVALVSSMLCLGCAWMFPSVGQGYCLVFASSFGLLALLVSGFSIGAMGWSFAWLNAKFGELSVRQFGMGIGALVVIVALLQLLAFGIARLGYFRGDLFVSASVISCGALLALFIAYPVTKALWAAFVTEEGTWSLMAMWERFSTERIWSIRCLSGAGQCGVAWNTLFLAIIAAVGTTVLGTMMALLTERSTNKALQGSLKFMGLLPIITPPFVSGLALILLFGRNGVVNQFLEWGFGIEPTRWFYGVLGIFVAQMFAFTPIAYMIMRGVVQGIAPSLEEAAQMLKASPMQTFLTITLPLLKPGLANAFLVGFIESIADFGNPIVVGAQFSVLSTEIYFAIVGAQLDHGKAATLAWILTLFALGIFALQNGLLGKKNYTTVSGKGDAGIAMVLPKGLLRLMQSIVLPWIAFTAILYIFAFIGGFVKTWGVNYSFTLEHFKTAFNLEWGQYGLVWSGTAWDSFWTTIKLSAASSPLTAAIGLLIAYLLARTEFKGQRMFEFIALLAFAIPGTVLGVSYIMAFNVPPIELTGTGLIIVLCFMFRNLPVGVRSGSAAFKQLDRSLDEASLMLRASTFQTLYHVVLPLLKPALIAALVYSFVRSMTTVSAVIFLITAETELATTYIIGRVGNGDYGVALAYCTALIVFMAISVGLIQVLIGERRLGRRKAGASTQVALDVHG